MTDNFNKALWELGLDNPDVREAIAKTINGPAHYSIPTRKLSTLTGELEDITLTVYEIEDKDQREREIAKVERAFNIPVKELVLRLNILHTAYTLKEVQGEELTPQERTLKDLDITALAYTLLGMNFPKQAYKSFESAEDYEEERKEIIGGV